MSTNWPKRKNNGTVFTNERGTTWVWNGKGWILIKNDSQIQSIRKEHLIFTFSKRFDEIFTEKDYFIELPYFTKGKITQITIMSKWRNYIPLENSQRFTLRNLTKSNEVVIISDFSQFQNNQVDDILLKDCLSIDEGDVIEIIWNLEKLTNTPDYVEFDFQIHLES